MRFSRVRLGSGAVKAAVDAVEAQVLGQCAQELLDLVEEPELGDDPLAALVGMSGDDIETPDEPVLLRLLPDAYRGDPGAASDFRRYTDADLRRTKRAHAQAVLGSLPSGGGELRLDRDGVDDWLGFLNDARLALGTAIGVTEQLEELPGDHPQHDAFAVYSWLGWLQESLLSCVDPRKPSS